MQSILFKLPLEILLAQAGISTKKIEFLIAAWPDGIKKVKNERLCLALHNQGKNTNTVTLLLNLWPAGGKTSLLVNKACKGKLSLHVLQNLIELWPDALCI